MAESRMPALVPLLDHLDRAQGRACSMTPHSLDALLSDAFTALQCMADALELPLLFHYGGHWDEAMRLRWRQITDNDDACTKVICDHIRKVLGRG